MGMNVCSVNGVVKLACDASSNLRLPLITALGTCSVALELEALTTVKLVLPTIQDATRLRLVPLTVKVVPAGTRGLETPVTAGGADTAAGAEPPPSPPPPPPQALSSPASAMKIQPLNCTACISCRPT